MDHPGSSQRISGHRLRLRQPASLEIVRQYPLERIHVVLEITERAAMELSAELKKKMEYMKEQGLEYD